ncbi:MAG TPA: hypothetical protein VIQ27_04645, partial [Gemmatimonadales bacterium]
MPTSQLSASTPLEHPISRIVPLPALQPSLLRAALPGLAVAVLTVLFGFGMGGLFGLNEDLIKDRLAASA